MTRKIGFIVVFVLGSTALFAQNEDAGHWPVTLGLKGGVPVSNMFNTGSSAPGTVSIPSGSSLTSFTGLPGTAYSSSVPRYEFGPSAEFHLPFHLRFEVDGLYKRGGFDNGFLTGAGNSGYMRTGFNQWEIPGVFKYNIALGHFRPFLEAGASYRHISTIDQQTFAPGVQAAYSDNSSALRNRNSFGGVAGFGITFKKGPFELTPEARYTRWANNSFAAPGLVSNKDQGDVLLGISF